MSITMLEAARRQLDTALKLWFAEGDSLSVHTLAAAAFGLVDRINKKRKIGDLIYDTVYIKDEYRTEYINFIKKSANFLKHGPDRKDKSETIELKPMETEMFLFMSIYAIQRFGETLNDTECALIFWYALHKPNWFTSTQTIINNDIPVHMMEKLRGLTRNEFFQPYLNIRHEQRQRGLID